MSEPVSNDLIYSVLQKIQADLAELRFDMGELKARASSTEEHLGNIILSISGTNRRIDRIEERLARVEHRLDLTDHH